MELSFLKEFTKGDPEKMDRYIRLYLEVAPKTFEEMKETLKAKDWGHLRVQAHSLKPQADFMGLNLLKGKLVLIEETIKAEQFLRIPQLFEVAFALHKQSLRDLEEYLQARG